MDHRSRVDTVCGRMSRTVLASSSLNRHDTSLRFALSIFSRAIFSTTELCHVVANTSLPLPTANYPLPTRFYVSSYILYNDNVTPIPNTNFSTTIRSLRIRPKLLQFFLLKNRYPVVFVYLLRAILRSRRSFIEFRILLEEKFFVFLSLSSSNSNYCVSHIVEITLPLASPRSETKSLPRCAKGWFEKRGKKRIESFVLGDSNFSPSFFLTRREFFFPLSLRKNAKHPFSRVEELLEKVESSSRHPSDPLCRAVGESGSNKA